MQSEVTNMAEELPEYEIRLMKKEDIPQVLDLWRETGFLEGTHSVDTWFEYDPEGFYVAATKDERVIGVCAGVLQHDNLAFIGMYVVKSTFQRRGIGRKIWDKVMERVGDRNAGVNPVATQLENYRDRAGFPIQSDLCSVVCIADQLLTSDMTTELPGVDVCVLSPEDTDVVKAVSGYESNVLGFTRERLMPILCAEKDSVTVVATKAHDNSVCGFGSIRQNINGNAHVSPLFADDHIIAEVILYHLKKAFPVAESKGVTMMIVDCNEAAMAMVDKLGFCKEPGTARLFRIEDVDSGLKKEIQFKKLFAQNNSNFSVF